MTRTTTLPALALAAALALAGCGNGQEAEAPATGGASPAADAAPTGTASAGSTPTGSTPAAGAAEISGEHNDADVMFAQMMIPHHEQAVQMSEILLGKDGVPQDVRDLAERVGQTQEPEIEQMQAMLTAWDAPATPDESATAHGGHGSGMVDEQGMNWLREAEEGPEAAELYLEQMIRHHEGATEMARDEVEQGSNPEAVELAREIVEAQEAEIEEMRTMQEELSQP
ncbi:DUF305 domain-containing protein [Kocuria turfanensis]|uniref:DUF305 domain-containing protein n=1 Tax=Kocuria turfanensis TaxID=388357 RepID=A0A512I8X2_9MICC|nr:DUF305 domain-containing protein [Kocuria turfanensis]GEO94131.1 DUF305 domain-containing protein [Kocuria turfanensis]